MKHGRNKKRQRKKIKRKMTRSRWINRTTKKKDEKEKMK
jgi:hypothetical protein